MKTFKEYMDESEDGIKTIENIVKDYLDNIKKLVEISIAKHGDEIQANPSKGMSTALDFVYNKTKVTSPLDDKTLLVAIKSALYMSLKENGYEDKGFEKTIQKELAKIKKV